MAVGHAGAPLKLTRHLRVTSADNRAPRKEKTTKLKPWAGETSDLQRHPSPLQNKFLIIINKLPCNKTPIT